MPPTSAAISARLMAKIEVSRKKWSKGNQQQRNNREIFGNIIASIGKAHDEFHQHIRNSTEQRRNQSDSNRY